MNVTRSGLRLELLLSVIIERDETRLLGTDKIADGNLLVAESFGNEFLRKGSRE